MSFAEVRFQGDFFHKGAAGGPQFSTTVVSVNSGFEQRNANWSQARGKWECGNRVLNESDAQGLIAFFRARQGRRQGFRFKDWSDYRDNGKGVVGDGFGGSFFSAQLRKLYESGSDAYARDIKKPVASTLKFFVNGVDQTANFIVDDTTGIADFVPVSTFAIATVTRGLSTTTITTTEAHGLTSGKAVCFFFNPGQIQTLNEVFKTITVTGANSFTVAANTNADGAYVSGGQVAVYFQAGDALTWTGEFDVPVRFDVDSFSSTVEAIQYINGNPSHGVKQVFVRLGSVPLVEVRQ